MHEVTNACAQAYDRAICKAVERIKEEEGEVHVLDMGCGSGLLSAMAARAGASTVVACDMHEPLCNLARSVRPPKTSHGRIMHQMHIS